VVEARWLEVSLTLDNELAEAVAEVLARYVSNGVVVESGVDFTDLDDPGHAAGPVRVYGYIIVDEHLEDTRQRLSEALWYLGRIQPLPEPAFRPIQDEDWMSSWKKHYHPIPIGKRLLVLPAWAEQTDLKRIAVRIDPSMAFGTGTHPSTQLCLEMIETYTLPGQPAIDVGCGSGILSIAALKLGASHALGVDIDNASIRATRENAEANGVINQTECGPGSVQEVLAGSFSIRQAPLVLANILANVLIGLLEEGLANLVPPGGVLVMAGILAEQSEKVQKAAAAHNLTFLETRQSGDWVALAFRR
jgi:ribosomal protein L11 methyltransferase